MGQSSKAFPIDVTGRVLITEAADSEVKTVQLGVGVTPGAVEMKITSGPLKRRKLLITVPLEAPSDIVVYIGGANTVNELTGYPMYHLDQLELDVNDQTEVWAMVEEGKSAGKVHIMEVE